MSESPIEKKARDQIAAARKFAENKLEPLQKKLSALISDDIDTISLSLTRDELSHICIALQDYDYNIQLKARQREQALDCGSEDGFLENQSDKDVLNGCIGLICEAVGEIKEYLEENCSDIAETVGSFGFSYFRIVQRLFLFNTMHSGGTSTCAKCRQLGVDPSEVADFWIDEENDE